MITDVIIMAGGFGERLWPASSPSHPKQFMALNDNISFLQESLRRSLALKISGKIIIVTRKDIEGECVNQIKSLAERSDDADAKKLLGETIVLAEPSPKHTSAAIMIGVELLQKLDPEKKHTFLVLTSDHVISPVGKFVSDAKNAADAAHSGKFVCFSIVPTEPSTGYGYIKAGKDITGIGTTFEIEKFEEKPDLATATEYLKSGNYFWNSGMFFWRLSSFQNEFGKANPVMAEISGFRGSSSAGGSPRSAFADVLEVPVGIEPVDYGRPDDREQPDGMLGAGLAARGLHLCDKCIGMPLSSY